MVNYIKKRSEHTVEVSLDVYLVKEGEYVVSYCPALELSSYGLTEVEAKESFDGMLQTFLHDTQEKGTLEKVLLDLGWTLKKVPTVNYRPPIKKHRHTASYISSFNERVHLPL